MSNAWDTAKQHAEETGGGSFLRLKDNGDKAVVAFLGDPEVEEVAWNQKTSQYEPYTPAHKAAGTTPSGRYKINVWDKKDKGVKVWTMNNATFKTLIKNREKYTLSKKLFEIERNGAKGDTKTVYSILPDEDITDELRTTLAAAKLHDLKRVTDDAGDESTDMNSHKAGAAAPAGSAAAPAPTAAPTIDDATSKALVDRLRALPREVVTGFLTKFGIAQVKLLKNSDLPEALRFIEAAEPKASPAPPAEVDPFG